MTFIKCPCSANARAACKQAAAVAKILQTYFESVLLLSTCDGSSRLIRRAWKVEVMVQPDRFNSGHTPPHESQHTVDVNRASAPSLRRRLHKLRPVHPRPSPASEWPKAPAKKNLPVYLPQTKPSTLPKRPSRCCGDVWLRDSHTFAGTGTAAAVRVAQQTASRSASTHPIPR